jgi:hypothetical protein
MKRRLHSILTVAKNGSHWTIAGRETGLRHFESRASAISAAMKMANAMAKTGQPARIVLEDNTGVRQAVWSSG